VNDRLRSLLVYFGLVEDPDLAARQEASFGLTVFATVLVGAALAGFGALTGIGSAGLGSVAVVVVALIAIDGARRVRERRRRRR
jgi:hypothetical protein